MAQKTVFISYSQKDKERVSLFASLMTQNGFDVWMDVKKISLGESIVSAISNGLDNSDIYEFLYLYDITYKEYQEKFQIMVNEYNV